MGDKTKIQWTDATWNPLRGCSRVSDGCRNCYAESVAHRFSGPGMPYEGLTRVVNGRPAWTGEVRTVPELLDQPLRWKRPRRIFVNSMSDLFHENVPDDFLPWPFAVMATAKQHVFQVLTKRPERMRRVMNDGAFFDAVACMALQVYGAEITADDWPLSNVWLGVSVENQAAADERIPLLLDTPAAVRWISAEPLLGPVSTVVPFDGATVDAARGARPGIPRIDWIVAGGESGPHARPMHPDWVRSLRDQCAAAGVPFHLKQITERGRPLPMEQWPEDLRVQEFHA